jgi:hypothetical protein
MDAVEVVMKWLWLPVHNPITVYPYCQGCGGLDGFRVFAVSRA